MRAYTVNLLSTNPNADTTITIRASNKWNAIWRTSERLIERNLRMAYMIGDAKVAR